MTKISSSLPDFGENGLEAIEDQLVDDPHGVHLVIAFVDCKSVKTDHEKGTVTPTARFRSIEVVRDDEDRALAARLMQRAHERRTGLVALPFALEADVQAAFSTARVDPETGEKRS